MDFQQLKMLASSITNPKQAIYNGLMLMEKKQPEQARMIAKIFSTGKDPREAISEFARTGQLNLTQLENLKKGYKYAKGIGLKINVPQDTWDEAEQLIKNTTNTGGAPSRGGF